MIKPIATSIAANRLRPQLSPRLSISVSSGCFLFPIPKRPSSDGDLTGKRANQDALGNASRGDAVIPIRPS